jgi:hypothetical protein
MANKNFVVHNGLTVGPLTIDAATGDITTSGNVNISGSVGVSSIAKNDSSISITDTGSGSNIRIIVDGATVHTVNADGVNLGSGDRYAIDGASVLNATTLGSAVVNSSLTTVGNLTSLSVAGAATVYGNLTVQGLTTLNGGTLTLGDANTDNVVFGADINSSVIPNTDATYHLGSSGQKWGNVFAVNYTGTLQTASQTNITQVGNLTALTVAGAVNVTTSLTVDGGSYGNVVTTQYGSLFATAYGPNNYSILQAWSSTTGGALGMLAFGNIIYSSGAINFNTGVTIRDKDYPTGGVTKVTITAAGDLWANATTPSTSTTTGALVVGGGAGIAGNINAGNVIATNLTGTLLTASQTNVTTVGNLTAITVGGSTSLIGVVYANANSESTSTTSGALRVRGGVGVTGNISAGGQITIAGAIAATQADATALAIALG